MSGLRAHAVWRTFGTSLPPTRRSGLLVSCGRVAEQRRKGLVGCTAHQLLIGAPITSSALESGQRELIATEATPGLCAPTSPAIVRRIDDLPERAPACRSELPMSPLVSNLRSTTPQPAPRNCKPRSCRRGRSTPVGRASPNDTTAQEPTAVAVLADSSQMMKFGKFSCAPRSRLQNCLSRGRRAMRPSSRVLPRCPAAHATGFIAFCVESSLDLRSDTAWSDSIPLK
jgi:hypothetical protein